MTDKNKIANAASAALDSRRPGTLAAPAPAPAWHTAFTHALATVARVADCNPHNHQP